MNNTNTSEIISRIKEYKIIAIIRNVNEEKLIPLCQALYDGGIRLVEVTYSANAKVSDKQTAAQIKMLASKFKGKLYAGAGCTAFSIFKDNSMWLVDDLLYICFSFITEDGKSHISRKTFNIKTETWVGEALIKLRYKEEDYDFSDETINRIYIDHNVEPRAKGLIELVSEWNEYNGEYYATGLTIEGPNHGLIVKTRDFCTMEFVDIVSFNDMGASEIASHIFNGKLYVACRQNTCIPYLYLGSLDLTSMEWKPYHKISDGNVRPWFFEYKGELYLINTIQENYRQYTNISRVTTNTDRCPTEIVATIKNCGSYYATANYNDNIYFVASHNAEVFGKLCLHLHDEYEVNQKFLSLFE